MSKHDKPVAQIIQCAPTIWEVALNSLPERKTVVYIGRTFAILTACLVVYKLYKNRASIISLFQRECPNCKMPKFKKPLSPKAEKLDSDSLSPESPRKSSRDVAPLPSLPERDEPPNTGKST